MSTETTIQRYSNKLNTWSDTYVVVPDADGEYVLYEHHLAAVEEAREAGFAEAREAAAKVVDEGNKPGPYEAIERAAIRAFDADEIRALRPAEKGEKA